MKASIGPWIAGVPALALLLVVAAAPGASQGSDPPAQAKTEIPASVLKAIRENAPGAEIENLTIEENGGIRLYDIEFKADRGEIEVAEDGTVIDVSVVVRPQDIPKAAADALRKAAAEAGAEIRRLERSEVRAEVQIKDGKGRVVRLAAPRYVYEAELVRGKERGEVAVDPDGRIVEALKWEKGA